MQGIIRKELLESKRVLDSFLADSVALQAIERAALLLSGAVKSGNKIFSCGNGGSACDAVHFAEELTGKFRDDRKPIPALAISDLGHITCTANDFGYEAVFARYLEALGKPGDGLLAISTSGNSPNVLRAAEYAKKNGMFVVALTGKDGGKLASLADAEIRVPHFGYSDRIQEVHIKIIHILILLTERQLASDHAG